MMKVCKLVVQFSVTLGTGFLSVEELLQFLQKYYFSSWDFGSFHMTSIIYVLNLIKLILYLSQIFIV